MNADKLVVVEWFPKKLLRNFGFMFWQRSFCIYSKMEYDNEHFVLFCWSSYIFAQFGSAVCLHFDVWVSFHYLYVVIVRLRKVMKQGRSSLTQNLFHQPNILGIRTKLLRMPNFPCRSSQYVFLALLAHFLHSWSFRIFVAFIGFLKLDLLKSWAVLILPRFLFSIWDIGLFNLNKE